MSPNIPMFIFPLPVLPFGSQARTTEYPAQARPWENGLGLRGCLGLGRGKVRAQRRSPLIHSLSVLVITFACGCIRLSCHITLCLAFRLHSLRDTPLLPLILIVPRLLTSHPTRPWVRYHIQCVCVCVRACVCVDDSWLWELPLPCLDTER